MLDGMNLAAALESVATTGFDFSAWLALAIRRRWLKGVVRRVD